MITKQEIKKFLVEDTVEALADEGLSHALIASAREELSKLTELPPDAFRIDGVETIEEGQTVIDVLEEFLNYVEAFGK